jgi:hypothetical protein
MGCGAVADEFNVIQRDSSILRHITNADANQLEECELLAERAPHWNVFLARKILYRNLHIASSCKEYCVEERLPSMQFFDCKCYSDIYSSTAAQNYFSYSTHATSSK